MDKELLESTFEEVVICQRIIEVLMNISKCSLVYCWWWHTSFHVVLLSRLFRVPVFVTGAIHMFDQSGTTDFDTKNPLYRIFSRISLYFADKNLFISRDQLKQITSHIAVRNPVALRSSLIKDIDTSPERILNSRSQIRSDSNVKSKNQFLTIVWHTQAQHRRKGIYETLEACKILFETGNTDFNWVIAGKFGPGADFLRQKIEGYGLENHVFLEFDLSQEGKNNLYLKSDLYLQPSWYEGFGNAVLEAMSHGLPALVSRYSAQPEVVGNSGLVCLDLSPEAIFVQLQYFVGLNEKDKKLMCNRAIEKVNQEFVFERRQNHFKEIWKDFSYSVS